MTRRIIALISGQLVVAAVAVTLILLVADVPIEPAPLPFVVYTLILTGLTLLPPIYVESSRHASLITPTDGAYVIGLILLGPLGLVVAVAIAEIASWPQIRLTPLKHAFNLTMMIAGASLGGLAYVAVGATQPLDPQTWVGAVLALAVIGGWSTVMTAAAVSISEHQPLGRTTAELVPQMLVTLAASVPLALVALVLYAWSPPSLLLLVPILALLHLSTRAAVRQQAARQRTGQLAEASAQLVELVETKDLLARVAEQSRQLVTGADAVAIALEAAGPVGAQRVDDRGVHEVDARLQAVLLELVGDTSQAQTRQGQVLPSDVEPSVRAALPPFQSLVWVMHLTTEADGLVVVVFRELRHDGEDVHRTAILATFVAHATTALANVRLHADVNRSLAQEQALNQRKNEFVATVSHELRTPLTSILGAVETLRRRDRAVPAADATRLLDAAHRHGRRLRGLVEDLLVVAEAEHYAVSQRRVPVDVPRLLTSLENEFQPGFQGRLQVHAHLPERWVTTDAEKLRRILGHLLDNARKYAPEVDVALTATQHDDRLEIVVSDSGPGIAPQDRELVFEPFVQLDSSSTREGAGLGLGLHLSRQLAQVMGGELSVEANPTGGTRAVLSLPLGPSR